MNQLKLLITTLLWLFISSQCLALSTDRDQPADIEADDIEFDFKQGIRTYKKNVIIVQGTLRIKADELVGLYSGSDLKEATATGSLARFKQRPDGKPDDVEGWAEKIVVDQANNILTLYGKAGLKQGAQTAQGETIIYDMANDTLKVQGDARASSRADGTTPTDRKLEDPFKDDPIPTEIPIVTEAPVTNVPLATDTAIPTTVPTAQSANQQPSVGTSQEDPTEVDVTPIPKRLEPVPSGRSRLIIQPK